jgi:hypothetical protein
MQTVELEEYIFQTDYIVKNNFLQNSSFFCQSKSNSDFLYSQYIYVYKSGVRFNSINNYFPSIYQD